MIAKHKFTGTIFAYLLLTLTVLLTSHVSTWAFVSAPNDKPAPSPTTPPTTHAEVLARIKAEQNKAKQNQTDTHEQAEQNIVTHKENKQVHVENKAHVEVTAEHNKTTHESNKVTHEENKQKHKENLERIETIKNQPTLSTPIHKSPSAPTTPVQPETTPQKLKDKPETVPTQPTTPTPVPGTPEGKLTLPEVPTGSGGEYLPEKKILIRTGGF